jgi:hypothetical protein
MAKMLFGKNAKALESQKKAPVNTGADSASMGMDSENNAALIPGGKTDKVEIELKKVKADIEVSFYLPFAMMGKSSAAVPFPVIDGEGLLTGKVEYKQINLKDKFFTALKKDMKNDAYWKRYKELMIKAGFEMYSSIKNLKDLSEYKAQVAAMPPKKSKTKKIQKMFGSFRAEHLTSEAVFNFAFQCGDKVRTFAEVRGRLFTDDLEMHKIFIKNGYEDMGFIKDSQKPSKEILPKEEEGGEL